LVKGLLNVMVKVIFHYINDQNIIGNTCISKNMDV